MSLKEELENIEIEEIEMDEEDRLRKIEESMYWLNRKIKAIAEYIDKEEKATAEEDGLWQDGFDTGWDECEKRVTNKAEVTKEEGTSSEYASGYKDGAEALAEKLKVEIDKSMENKKELLEVLGKALSIKMPSFGDAQTIISQIQQASKKETTEGEPKEAKEKETTKSRALGLGRTVGEV
jgi:hypothetical protein